ncbi:Conserved_hypothetical protein [Hexamita inflata]|uniref:Uncharacterized protein n=1 Tax=Hexamita inflata TaxID=28002 RepID=A0AA86QQJ5_9EUKA|nr:Conserved hypothetical protein [Hexamita inflata]CAI9964034.1 Conserved hypothetical protein [Hexamita inflata]
MPNIFCTSPQELAKSLENYPGLESVVQSLRQNEISGYEFFQYSAQAVLTMLHLDCTSELVNMLNEVKAESIANQMQNNSMQMKYACIVEKQDKTIQLCCPTANPQIFEVHVLIQNVILVEGAVIEPGAVCECIFRQNDLVHVIVHPQSYVQPNFGQNLQQADSEDSSQFVLDEAPLSQHQDIFQIPTAPLQQQFSNLPTASEPNLSFNAEPNMFFSQPIHTEPAQQRFKLQLKESSSQPVNTKQFNPGFVSGMKLAGRVDFLIDQIGFVVVPKEIIQSKMSEDDQIKSLREFEIGTGLGLVVAFNTQYTPVQLIRGDIIEFELVPGYNYGNINTIHPAYPMLCEKSIRRTPGVIEYEEYFRNSLNTEQFTPFADSIKLISRIEKPIVSKNYLIHGNYYTGVVYTFYDNEGYGFIKSYGNLENARCYAQGFEVYFKVQTTQRQQYIPRRGDIVTFKSHWVDEKAQARDIRLKCVGDEMMQTGQCVGLCPPYAVFASQADNEELRNNLFFCKLKNVAAVVKLGQQFTFNLDPDISSHFRAGQLAPEAVPIKFGLSQSPGKTQLTTVKQLPWGNEIQFSRLHPLFKKANIVIAQPAGKVIQFTVQSTKPLILNQLGIELTIQNVLKTEQKKDKYQYVALYSTIQDKPFAIEVGDFYKVNYHGISEEYVFFTVDTVGFAIPRQWVPYASIMCPSVKLGVDLSSGEFQCLRQDDFWFVVLDECVDFESE